MTVMIFGTEDYNQVFAAILDGFPFRQILTPRWSSDRDRLALEELLGPGAVHALSTTRDFAARYSFDPGARWAVMGGSVFSKTEQDAVLIKMRIG